MQEKARREVIRKKRRNRALKKLWRMYRKKIMFAVFLLVVVITAVVIGESSNSKAEKVIETEKETQKPEQTEAPEEETEEKVLVYDYPFNTMSQDWEADALDGLKEYTIPSEYTHTGGDFPLIMQQYLWIICNKYEFDYVTAVALIECESGYTWNAYSESGAAGYMQIMEEHHKERMEKLNYIDLINPFQNVVVGIDYLSELQRKYGDMDKTLTAYYYGQTGAENKVFQYGETQSEYSKNVQRVAERIRKELKQ